MDDQSKDKSVDVHEPIERHAPPETSRLRLLDFDDLFVLRYLAEGHTIAMIAVSLGLSQPAISQRMRKIERAFDTPVVRRAGRGVQLTPEGLVICAQATEALVVMHNLTADAQLITLTIGVAAPFDHAWLWPVMGAMKGDLRPLAVHWVPAAVEDLATRLLRSQIDAYVTFGAAPLDAKLERHILLTSEMIAVAAPALIGGDPSGFDLSTQTLLDIDATDPLASLACESTWFLGSLKAVLSAVLSGLGVAYLPEYLVRNAISSGQLVVLSKDVAPTQPFALSVVFPHEHRHRSYLKNLTTRMKLVLEPLVF